VVDATCPHVIRIQKLIAKHIEEGCSIVIVGDHGHAEVEGLLGHAQGRGRVVSSEADVAALPDMERVCVVSQTTQSFEHFDRLLGLMQKRWPDLKVFRTICGSTDKRQKETVELARKVDAMIVVGGRNSANTVRLAELSAETGTPTQHVETSDEIDFAALRKKRVVGLTAGASTPNWMILEVSERVKEEAARELPPWRRAGPLLLKFLLDTHLFLIVSAVCLGLAVAAMSVPRAGAGVPWAAILSAALYIFAMYTFTIPVESRSERFNDPLRWRFHQKWRRPLTALGIAALLAALATAFQLGLWSFLLMILGSLLGVAYCVSALPAHILPFLRYRRLVDIPGSKDIFMGLAWAFMLVLLPLVSRGSFDNFISLKTGPPLWITAAICFLHVFTLVAVRSVVFDLRDIQSDQIVGRETIPILIGKERTRVLLAALTGLLAAAMLIGVRWGALTGAGYLMLLPLAYTWGYLYLYHRRAILDGLAFEAIVDGKFILAGLLALLWLGILS
jgi:4-hydroxy-3-methylbut-2-enyl diphosphate reductase